jgi:galactokinase
MNGKNLLSRLENGGGTGVFTSLYGASQADEARKRYASLITGLLNPAEFPAAEFPETAGDVRVFTAPGRTELGGNHTDHNRGKVLAAAIQLDAVAIAAPRRDSRVFFRSIGHPDVSVDLAALAARPQETGTTEALIRGIAAEFAARGTPVRGFTANAGSNVFTGSGLSSSAAMEVLIGKIFDHLYGQGKRSALEIAQIGQKAENSYFGKPSGLEDQAACASGGAVAIDFADEQSPQVKAVNFDPAVCGYALCVAHTRGSHADLTPDYAAIPREMNAVARFFGKAVLRETSRTDVLAHLPELRTVAGDRAVLRALHFFAENDRVDDMVKSIERLNAAASQDDKQAWMEVYLTLVNRSGDSAWELLQNSYSPKAPQTQGVSLALALTREFLAPLDSGACRVHGGGFAGTIQAYIPSEALEGYRSLMEAVFGTGAVTELRIRPVGAAELEL